MKENEIFCSFSTFWEKQKWKMNSWFVTSSKTWKTSRFSADLNKRWKLFWRMGSSKINHGKKFRIIAIATRWRYYQKCDTPDCLFFWCCTLTIKLWIIIWVSGSRTQDGLLDFDVVLEKTVMILWHFLRTNFKIFFGISESVPQATTLASCSRNDL